jgi:putative membrane protein
MMTGRIAPVLVGTLGAYLLYAYATGALYFYIHPVYLVPTVLTGIVLVAIAVLGAGGLTHGAGHDQPSRLNIFLWALPVAAGVLLPARPLGVTTAAQRGVEALPLGRIEDAPEFRVDIRPETLTIKDWVKTLQADPEPERIAGKPVRLIGFVYRDERLPADWFLVARFVVQCCAVDAQPIGVPVRLAGQEIPRAGTWVSVLGAWQVASDRGERRAVVVPTAVMPTERPEQPYLY